MAHKPRVVVVAPPLCRGHGDRLPAVLVLQSVGVGPPEPVVVGMLADVREQACGRVVPSGHPSRSSAPSFRLVTRVSETG